MKNVFIHGWSFSSQIWKDFFGIKDSIFLDLPFHGENKNYVEKDIINHFVNDLIKRLDSDEKINLIGWSLGASISFLTALQLQEKINKLILIGFSPKFKDKNLGHNPVAIKAFMVALRTAFEPTIYTFRKNAAGDPFKEIPLPQKNGSIKLLKEFIELNLTDKLIELRTKTILIHGKEDIIINPEAAVFTANRLKKSELFLIDGNHAPFLKNKNLIKKIIEE